MNPKQIINLVGKVEVTDAHDLSRDGAADFEAAEVLRLERLVRCLGGGGCGGVELVSFERGFL